MKNRSRRNVDRKQPQIIDRMQHRHESLRMSRACWFFCSDSPLAIGQTEDNVGQDYTHGVEMLLGGWSWADGARAAGCFVSSSPGAEWRWDCEVQD